MDRIFNLINNVAFFTTLFGVAFIVSCALPGSKLPECVSAVAKWCAAALDAAKKNRR